MKIACEPQIQHGERRDRYRPTEDGTSFAKVEELPVEKFSKLAFETTLGTDDCLVIGWNAEQANTIGSVFFAVEADNRPRQRCSSSVPSRTDDRPPATCRSSWDRTDVRMVVSRLGTGASQPPTLLPREIKEPNRSTGTAPAGPARSAG